MRADPLLISVFFAIGGVVFVNGWTDAPTAIVTCVASGAMKVRRAAVLAAFCNLLGVGASFAVTPAVAITVKELIVLPEHHADRSLAVLLCALVVTGLWAVAAWFFGIPTSESHGLLAGLSGAAVAYGGVTSVNGGAWGRVFLGLGLSFFGGLFCGGVAWLWFRHRRSAARRVSERRMGRYLIAGAAAMAFMHGAQDGQKFVGLWLLALAAVNGKVPDATLPPILLCATLMGTGTLLGGGRIIRTLGEKLVRTGYEEGFSADIGAAVCLLLLTVGGLPVSTTHTKTAAIMGVGITKGRGRLDTSTAAKLLVAWLLTFPVCFGAGWGLMRILFMG